MLIKDKSPHWYLGTDFLPGFVMEKINGIRLYDLRWSDRRELFHRANYLRLEELDKVEALGFIPCDATGSNAFYLEAEDKVVLFDFDGWKWKK